MQEQLWLGITKGLGHQVKHKMELLNAVTTRLSDVASTIRASIYKQGERNLIKNLKDGDGYEGVIEIWEENKQRQLE